MIARRCSFRLVSRKAVHQSPVDVHINPPFLSAYTLVLNQPCIHIGECGTCLRTCAVFHWPTWRSRTGQQLDSKQPQTKCASYIYFVECPFLSIKKTPRDGSWPMSLILCPSSPPAYRALQQQSRQVHISSAWRCYNDMDGHAARICTMHQAWGLFLPCCPLRSRTD